MKTTLLTLTALALLAAPPASAQVEFGVRAGLNVATLGGGDASDLDPRLGFVGGGFARVPLNRTRTVALQPEVLYSMKGATRDDGTNRGTARLDYLEVPMLFRLAVPTGGPLDIGVMAGPTLGIPISTGFSVSNNTGGVSGTVDAASTDFGLALGADVGSGPFFVDLRYTLGLSDAVDGASFFGVSLGDPELLNRVFSVTAGYRF